MNAESKSLTTQPKKTELAPMSSEGRSEQYVQGREHIANMLATTSSDYVPFSANNCLHDRYVIDTSHELPQFSKTHVKAYKATDKTVPNAMHIAYLCDYNYPYRHHVLTEYKTLSHPSLISYVDSGVCFIKSENKNCFVIIYNKPAGISLRMHLEKNGAYSSSDTLHKLLKPIIAGLHTMHQRDIYHGSINPDNIFISSDKVVLGDCIAEPCGYSQPMIYEPVERLQASTERMRGDAFSSDDAYSLAMLGLEAMDIQLVPADTKKPTLINSLLTRGPYVTCINEGTLNSSISDIMRGCLTDTPAERWDIDQLVQFASGKRYNIVAPTPPKESPRPYEFAGKDYFCTRALAHAMYLNWQQAFEAIKDNKLVKWVEHMSNKEDIADRLTRLQERTERMSSSSTDADRFVARAIMLLDPYGPIRFKTMAIHPSAMPHELLAVVSKNNLADKVLFQQLITTDIVLYWRSFAPSPFNKLEWNPEKVSKLQKSKAFGFGIERILYEMLPHLPCLSHHYLQYYANSAKKLLLLMNHNAKDHASKNDLFTDRHIIAYLAAHTNMNKSVAVPEFTAYPDLKKNQEIACIATTAHAQEKTKIDTLPALNCWAALRCAEMAEHFHSTDSRKYCHEGFKAVLPKGKVAYLLHVMRNKTIIEKDCAGYVLAQAKYRKQKAKITLLENSKHIENRAENMGYWIASRVASGILFFVFYHLFSEYSM